MCYPISSLASSRSCGTSLLNTSFLTQSVSLLRKELCLVSPVDAVKNFPSNRDEIGQGFSLHNLASQSYCLSNSQRCSRLLISM